CHHGKSPTVRRGPARIIPRERCLLHGRSQHGRRIGARPRALVFQPVRKMPTIQVSSGCPGMPDHIWETSKMPRRPILLASAATLVLTLVAPASAQLLQHKDLSLSVALAIANGALDACKAMGYAASVVVVDRGGDTLVALRGDGSGPHTVENARRKAYTANTFKMTTE